MDPSYVSALHDLLVQATSNDTAQIKSATTRLYADFFKAPPCISALASMIASAPEIPVRQLAAVELRKRISHNSGDLWINLPQSTREEIKSQLPNIILAEPNKLVRHSAARVVAAIAAIEVAMGTWSQLLPFLHQASTAQRVDHREVGAYILYTVLETIMEAFQEHTQNLFQLFGQLLRDPESLEVRITTVRSLGVVAQYIDSDEKKDIKSFQALLPTMLEVIGQCVEAGDESGVKQLMNVLETLFILETPLLGPHVPLLAEFLLRCGGNRAYGDEIRVMILSALNWTIQYKKSKIQSHGLAPAILEGLMPIACEDEPEDIEDDAPSRSALRIIDGLSTTLPPGQVFPALRTLIQQYFSSENPDNRRGAMLALGISVEGCSEYMTPLLPQVWPLVEAGLQDLDASVRKATCVAVSCMCEWLEEQCVAKHEILVPAMMNLVADPLTQRSACTALDALLEILHDHIDQYLDLIMARLWGLLDSPSIPMKSVVVGAVGSAAHASKEKFLPYFTRCMAQLQNFLLLTGEGEEIELRGITMDAIGTFAEAVGPDNFRPYFANIMEQAFLGLTAGSARLSECSFLFFGVMAKVFGADFAVYLPKVLPPLLASCKQPEHEGELLTFSSDSKVVEPSSQAIQIHDADNGSSPRQGVRDIEDIDLDKAIEVNSAVAVEKEIAADTIGTLFVATREHFLPYVEPCTLELVSLLPHYYEGIRKSAIESLLEIIKTFYELAELEKWQPGRGVVIPLSQNVQELINHTIPPILEVYESEDDKSVVTTLCVSLAEAINTVGPALIEPHLDTLTSMAVQLLEQKALCQQDPDQDEAYEAPEDQAEFDAVLISAAADLVAALANALGAEFSKVFDLFFPLISKYYKKSRSLVERSMAVGCLGEIIGGMKSAITPSTQPLLELFYRALSDPEYEVQSNAAFAAGVLVAHSEQDLTPQYHPLLAALRPLFNVTPGDPTPKLNTRDNAAGAVARLIMRNASAVPLDQVLPVFIDCLPLRTDLQENPPAFRAIFYLFRTNPASLEPHMDLLARAFQQTLDPNHPALVGEEVKAELIELIRALQSAGVQQFAMFHPGS